MLASTGTFTASAKRRYCAELGHGLGEDHVGAGLDAGDGALDGGLQALHRQRIGARHDDEVRVGAASTAALMRSTISSWDTIALPGRWPQRLACTWSSMCTPAAPARISARTVRAMLKAPPQPVSTSTSSGSALTSVMRRTSVEHVVERGDAEVRQAAGAGRHAAAGEVERLEAGCLGQPRGIGVDGADHLQRLFPGDRLAQP